MALQARHLLEVLVELYQPPGSTPRPSSPDSSSSSLLCRTPKQRRRLDPCLRGDSRFSYLEYVFGHQHPHRCDAVTCGSLPHRHDATVRMDTHYSPDLRLSHLIHSRQVRLPALNQFSGFVRQPLRLLDSAATRRSPFSASPPLAATSAGVRPCSWAEDGDEKEGV